jgi:lipoprotein-releasing system permease protein
MGATCLSIMKIFVLEGLIIGFAGTVIGLAGGLLISLNLQSIVEFVQKMTGFELFSKDIYYLSRFPSKVVPSDVALIAVTAILISFIATLYPSWQGSRLPPAEALRYE